MSGRPTTAAPLERYVTRRELAEAMCVSESTIKRWDAEGMPSETWGMSRTRRYLRSEAVAWARERDTHPAEPPGIATAMRPAQRQPKE
jgi:phage terminase Nu1 subunit (DNA packaging protein)